MKHIIIILLLSINIGAWAQSNRNFEVSKQLDIFNHVYTTLEQNYVDTLNAERCIGDAINYMLDGMDPYTEYYPEKDTHELETLTTGKYAGIGAIIGYSQRNDRCIVREPYENMPAASAGVLPGDIIMKIDGKVIDKKGKQATNDYTSSVSNSLRGIPDTEIELVVDRPGTGEKTFRFKRAAIQLPAVTYHGMVSDNIGMVILNTFTRDCSQEVLQAVKALKKEGAKSIILDLRNNGGGLANEAVNIVNIFVPKGKLILQMKGKTKSANSSYVTTRAPEDNKIPLVVLVNGGSASASEITCGSLQDLDRAVILGERTYGKGLVQQPYSLPYGGLLKLTTSHYYIPSGRCIQALNYSHRGHNGEAYRTPDSLTHEFKTACGRIVRDGGGITPDIISKEDSLPNLMAYLQAGTILTEYIAEYRSKHTSIAPAAQFSINDEDYADFKKYLSESDFTYDRQTYKALQELKKIARFEGYDRTAAKEIAALEEKIQHNLADDLDTWKPFIIKMLNEEICRDYYYQKGAIESTLKHDKMLKDAINLLNNPDKYQQILSSPKK